MGSKGATRSRESPSGENFSRGWIGKERLNVNAGAARERKRSAAKADRVTSPPELSFGEDQGESFRSIFTVIGGAGGDRL